MRAGSIDEIIDAHRRLKRMVLLLQSTDIGPEHITRLISSVADSITHRIFDLAIQELGKAPVEFTFISFGSVGRDEQTMATDQDNAIVYGESAEFPENEIHSYFMRLGRKVCDMLAMSGYNHCKGGFMAKNPVWCKPISVWKAYFSEWVNTLIPQNLLDVSVLFDFRFSYGNRELAGELRQFVRSVTRNNDPFYYHLTENTLSIKLPGIIAGNIQNETTKKSQELLDIKKLMLPVVSFARIYALKAGCPETNTLSRLAALNHVEVLTDSDYQMISELYRFLMRLRLKNQLEQIRNDKTPDNFVSTTELSELDRVMLKKVLSQIVSLYTRLSYDFKRAIG
jgi:CBS domain-containing protein